VQRNSMRMGDAGHATRHARHVMLPRRQDALPVHHHLFYRILSAWPCALMGRTWSRVCAPLACTPASAVCPASTAHHAFQAFICRAASVEPPVLQGKSTVATATAFKIKRVGECMHSLTVPSTFALLLLTDFQYVNGNF
jgi:hypothetical protein